MITEHEILNYISRQPRHMAGYKQILHDLGVRGKERRPVEEMLRHLTRQKKLVAIGKERWALPTSASSQDLVVGQLRMHRDGYGFVTPDPDALPPRARGKLQGDIFIPPPEVGSAMHGDRVLVELGRIRPDGKGEGRILRVTEREQQTVVGVFHYGERYNYVRPIDEKVTAEIIIPHGMEYPSAEDEEEFQASVEDRDIKNPALSNESVAQALLPVHGRSHDAQADEQSARTHSQGEARSAQPRAAVPHTHGKAKLEGRSASHPQKQAHPRQRTPHRVLGEEARRRTWDDLENVVVEVEITQWPSATQNPRGRVVEILGYEDDFGVDVEIIIRKHHIRHVFPAAVLAEAQEISPVIPHSQIGHRRDFRNQPIVTIDGETARDFDDAVLVERLPHGHYRLQVHIADVAHYVEDGSAIDEEARKRGTSVYFPDRAVPMLPLELSTDICSLRPEVERLVLSCIMEIDAHGEVLSYELAEGIIRSAARMTYTDVNAIIQGDTHLRQRYAPLVTNFELMYELAQLLNRKRVKRGSIDFDLPEPVIEFDEFGLMKSVAPSERNWAHRLIEEFMLAANETVATHLEKHHIASLYRIHEKPDPKRIYDFETIAATFGYSLGVGALPIKRMQTRADKRSHYGSGRRAPTVELPEEVHVTPRMYQKLVQKITGKPEERVLSYLMLRSLKQARYSEINEGHFALAAPSYTHFTSPIRRYPDLIVHRILKEVIHDHGGPMRGHLKSSEEQASPWSNRRASSESSTSSPRRRAEGEASFSPRRHRDTEERRLLGYDCRGKSISFESGVAQAPSPVLDRAHEDQQGSEKSKSSQACVAQALLPVRVAARQKLKNTKKQNSFLDVVAQPPSAVPKNETDNRFPPNGGAQAGQNRVAQAPSPVLDRAHEDQQGSEKSKSSQACVAQALLPVPLVPAQNLKQKNASSVDCVAQPPSAVPKSETDNKLPPNGGAQAGQNRVAQALSALPVATAHEVKEKKKEISSEVLVAQPPSPVPASEEPSSLKNRVAQAPSPVPKNQTGKKPEAKSRAQAVQNCVPPALLPVRVAARQKLKNTKKQNSFLDVVAQPPSAVHHRADEQAYVAQALLPVPVSAPQKPKQKNASYEGLVAHAPSPVQASEEPSSLRTAVAKALLPPPSASHNLPFSVSPCLRGEDSSPLSTNASAHHSIYPVSPYRNRPDQHRSHKQETPPARQKHLKTVAGLSLETLHDIADSSSQAERAADEAERELLEWKKVKFMQDRIGEDFAGLIVSTTKYGFFVELTDLFIEGLVPLDSLLDDNYTFRENTRQIIGQHSRKTFSIGDRVRVIVDRIDHVQRKIQFALYEEAPSRAQKRHKKRG